MTNEESIRLDLKIPHPLRSVDLGSAVQMRLRNLGLPEGSPDISNWYLNIDDYEITSDYLGTGAHGQVYKAVHRVTNEAVAVKKIWDGDQLGYEREAVNAAMINHPTILPLIGCTRFSDTSAPKGLIVTPLMETGSLHGVLKQIRTKNPTPLPTWWNTTTKMKILLGTAIGGKVLWDHRMLYRDLKPLNILLDWNHEPKLCDFGLSKIVPEGSSFNNSMAVGTPMYLAPEVMDGGAYEFTADVYSFGLVIYAVWTAEEPYPPRPGENPIVGFRNRVVGGARPEFPPDTPERLVALAQRCWDGNPNSRPGIGEIVEELQHPALLASIPDLSRFHYREYAEKLLLAPRLEAMSQELAAKKAECDALLIAKTAECEARLREKTRECEAKLAEKTRECDTKLTKKTRECDTVRRELAEKTSECERLAAELEQPKPQAVPQRGLVRKEWAFGSTDLRRLEDWDWVEANDIEAVDAFEQSALRGNADDENDYGLCLFHGIGTAKDANAGARYFGLSAGHGSPFGQYNYGVCLANGLGVEKKNEREAARHFKLSADQGYAEAQVRYGLCLQRGSGIGKDLPEAVTFFQRSAEQGNANGEWRYGLCLQSGIGIAKNSRLAVTFFERSANQGNPDGERLFGQCLLEGTGIAKDAPRGAEFLKRSALQRNAEARWRYGVCLLDGVGVDQNEREAVMFFRGAAAQASAEGHYRFGLCLRNGIGTAVNQEAGERYLALARAQGLDI
jgi:TPR repeat protein